MSATDHCLAYLSHYHKDLAVVTADTLPPLGVLSSGYHDVDVALGGGWPRGRICALSGKEGVGKSTLAAMTAAEVHRAASTSIVLWIDGDHAFSPVVAKHCGMALSRTVVVHPDSMEQAFAVVHDAIHNGVGLAVVDSLCSLRPASESQSLHESNAQSIITAQALRLLLAPLTRHRATLLIINQLRSNHSQLFGTPTKTTGGNALRHYASVRAELKRQVPVKQESAILGHTAQFTVTGSKVFAPYRTAEVTFLYPQSATTHVPVTHWSPAEVQAPVLLQRAG